MTRFAGSVIIFFIIDLFSPSVVHAYEAKTHGKDTRQAIELIKKTDKQKVYRELYDQGYARQLVAGSEAGDFGNVAGNNRSFRHYYDPDAKTSKKGVKYFDYYQMWAYFDVIQNLQWNAKGKWIENLEVTPPPGGYYDDALEWARNSAGLGDMMNWEGALRVYDYTTDSRAQAYRRLGYVSHLVADMAQPDHVFNYPHPGSSYRWPPDNSDLIDKGIYYGFEALVENYINVIDFPGKEIKKLGSLDDHFNEMVKITKKTAPPSRYALPLGLETKSFSFDMYTIPGLVKEGKPNDSATMTRMFDAKDVAIMPAINDNKPQERNKYLNLAKELLNQATEFNAGTLELFYDVVNQPPYVEDVKITQDNEQIYHSWWEDTYTDFREPLPGVPSDAVYRKVSSRHLQKNNLSVMSDKEAVIRITFGPKEDTAKEIDPASVNVKIGDMEVPGAMVEPRVWEGAFTYIFPDQERSKELPIHIYAKDIHNHFQRSGMPEKGYALDRDPYTPTVLSAYKPPYPWKGYEPGTDTNFMVKVEKTTPPPIVQSIRVFSDDVNFKKASWVFPVAAQDRAMKPADGRLEQEPNVRSGGIDIGKFDSASVRIMFSQPVDENSVRVKLGQVDLPGSVIDDLTYEAAIPLMELGKPGRDNMVTFQINAKGISGLELDAKPKTVSYMDKKAGCWLNQETGADATHSIRIFGTFSKPVLKGCVHELSVRSGKIGKPLSGWNVIMYVTSIELKDKALAEKVLRLARSCRAAKSVRRLQANSITKQQKSDCLELTQMKDKVRSSCHTLSGSEPGWITKTDANGNFTFPLYKNPGQDGVIQAHYTFYVFPPENSVTNDPRDRISNTAIYDIFFDWNYMRDHRQWIDLDLTREQMRSALSGTPSPDNKRLAIADSSKKQRLVKLIGEYAKQQKERDAAEAAVAQLKEEAMKSNEWPPYLEKTWQNHALKMQREFEKEFKSSHGDSSGWDEETRKIYQDKMYDIPKQAKALWEDDVKKFDQEKKKTKEALRKSEEKLAAMKANNLDEQIEKVWADIYYDVVVDIPLISEMNNVKSENIYEIGGTVSGEEMTPKIRGGYATEMHLIKRGVDEIETKAVPMALSVVNNSRMVCGNLKDPKTPQPPYRFTFNEKIPEHLVINKYVRLSPEARGVPVCAGLTFFELTTNGYHKQMTDNAINSLWGSFVLPKSMNVEGIEYKPIKLKDEKRYKQLMEENKRVMNEVTLLGEKYAEIMRKNPNEKKYYEDYKQQLNKLMEKSKKIVEEMKQLME